MRIGVLALQGDFDAHRRRLEELGAEVVLVKKPEQLNEIDGLVIPGGESGTFLKLLGEDGFAKLRNFVRAKPTFGTCAGCILLAAEVENPKQAGLGALDITVRRTGAHRTRRASRSPCSRSNRPSIARFSLRCARYRCNALLRSRLLRSGRHGWTRGWIRDKTHGKIRGQIPGPSRLWIPAMRIGVMPAVLPGKRRRPRRAAGGWSESENALSWRHPHGH